MSLAVVAAMQAGGLTSQGRVVLILDGYSAPITAGNFLVNVMEGLYNNK